MTSHSTADPSDYAFFFFFLGSPCLRVTIPVTSCSFTFLSVNFKYSDTGHADVYSNLVVLNLVNHFFCYSRKKYVLFSSFFFYSSTRCSAVCLPTAAVGYPLSQTRGKGRGGSCQAVHNTLYSLAVNNAPKNPRLIIAFISFLPIILC